MKGNVVGWRQKNFPALKTVNFLFHKYMANDGFSWTPSMPCSQKNPFIHFSDFRQSR